jgi:hypothetical protein
VPAVYQPRRLNKTARQVEAALARARPQLPSADREKAYEASMRVDADSDGQEDAAVSMRQSRIKSATQAAGPVTRYSDLSAVSCCQRKGD